MAGSGGSAQAGQDRILAQRFRQAIATAFAADADLQYFKDLVTLPRAGIPR